MNIGLYQSAASLSALERWQDVTAQNITASQVTGYRRRTVEFSGVSMGGIQADPARGRIGSVRFHACEPPFRPRARRILSSATK